MFARILVANRGEIAVRVIRTAREMGIETVAVYSDADRDGLHVRLADEAFHLGPASPAASYLNVERLLEVARQAGADAIHPGYGFLAENAAFARAAIGAGLGWIGPHPAAIDEMGDKVRARRAMIAAGVPVVPGGDDALADVAAARRAAEEYGLPLALKASGGGGGKGLKVAYNAADVETAFTTAQREAQAYFKNGTIYAERYLVDPKHVEIQILADKHGTVVHVGERDCSLQRRHQKLLEETPAPIAAKTAAAMRAAAIKAAKAIEYDSAGTVECLVSGSEFYFLEMNTRIQVEHTVTEMISGLDLVREQIRVAAGERLGYEQNGIVLRGHAIEARVNAEDPASNFRPVPGTIQRYREPGGPGVRVDSAAYAGYSIPADYDSMIAKLVVWAPTRPQALARMRRALGEYDIAGVPTTIPLLAALCADERVAEGTYGTALLEPFAAKLFATARNGAVTSSRAAAPSREGETIRVEIDDRLYHVRLVDLPPAVRASQLPAAPRMQAKKRAAGPSGNDVEAPMHGVLLELSVKEGDTIATGAVVAVIEAMKMMNEIRAHKDGVVRAVHARVGETVEAGSKLVTLE
ncbi:MAG: acetyl-CoA carboxylase biotin carboxylase subunit [Candidatus Eremiobacteraeota bacterium]|nr:acetyl-CoA carboxylase biotin carboxylase subunit [Candidatus Eremiobacteraeota bacterium]